MKKILLFTILIYSFSTAIAQQTDLYGTVGVNIGLLNVSKAGSHLAYEDPIGSFQLGVFADYKFGNFSLNPGVFFSGKGGEYFDSQDHLKQLRLYYIQVPVNLVYNLNLKAGKLYFGGGPYASMGTGGNVRTYIPGSKTTKSTLNLFNKNTSYRIGDAGGQATIGFKFKSGYIINANYDFGAANVLSDRGNITHDKKLKNQLLGLSFGHVF